MMPGQKSRLMFEFSGQLKNINLLFYCQLNELETLNYPTLNFIYSFFQIVLLHSFQSYKILH